MGYILSAPGHELVVTARKHYRGVILNERESVSKEIAKHGVAAPAAEDTYFIGVDSAKKESHGAAGTEGPSRNVIRLNPGMAGDGERCGAKKAGDHGTGNGTFTVLIIKVSVQRSS